MQKRFTHTRGKSVFPKNIHLSEKLDWNVWETEAHHDPRKCIYLHI